MDKILLVTFLSSIAVFITAVISMVKLVNEKENKTGEFRQLWINSVRTCISDLAAKLTAVTEGLEYQKRLMDLSTRLAEKEGEINEKRRNDVEETLKTVRSELTEHHHDLYQSYALCKLHFKPNENEFKPIEEKFNLIFKKNDAISKSKVKADRFEMKFENYAYIEEIIEVGRSILKKEWERVKSGENIYIRTKQYSFFGGIFMLFLFLSVAGYALFFPPGKVENNSNDDQIYSKAVIKPDAIKCWQLQNFGERIFKLDSCTGEVIELNNDVQQMEN